MTQSPKGVQASRVGKLLITKAPRKPLKAVRNGLLVFSYKYAKLYMSHPDK